MQFHEPHQIAIEDIAPKIAGEMQFHQHADPHISHATTTVWSLGPQGRCSWSTDVLLMLTEDRLPLTMLSKESTRKMSRGEGRSYAPSPSEYLAVSRVTNDTDSPGPQEIEQKRLQEIKDRNGQQKNNEPLPRPAYVRITRFCIQRCGSRSQNSCEV